MNVQLIVERLLKDPKVKAILAARTAEFDPFAALAIEEYELRHTTTLAWLLDPRESHALGDRFLRAFLRSCLGAELEERVASAVVIKEPRLKKLDGQWRFVGSRFRESVGKVQGARLDVLLELTLVDGARRGIAIEGKVKAKEHGDQLSSYRLAMEQRFPGAYDLLFLTVAGDIPAEKEEIRAWRPITWSRHVAEPLLAVLAGAQTATNVPERVQWFLDRYIALIRRFSEDERDTVVREVDALWRDSDIRKLLTAARLDEDGNGDLCMEIEKDRWFLEMVNRSRLKSPGTRLVDQLFHKLEGDVAIHEWHGQQVLFLPKEWPGPLLLNGEATFMAYSLEFVAAKGNDHVEMKLWFGTCGGLPQVRTLQEGIFSQLAVEQAFQSASRRRWLELKGSNGKMYAFNFRCKLDADGEWSLEHPAQFDAHVRGFSQARRSEHVQKIATLLPPDHEGLEALLRPAPARRQPVGAQP